MYSISSILKGNQSSHGCMLRVFVCIRGHEPSPPLPPAFSIPKVEGKDEKEAKVEGEDGKEVGVGVDAGEMEVVVESEVGTEGVKESGEDGGDGEGDGVDGGDGRQPEDSATPIPSQSGNKQACSPHKEQRSTCARDNSRDSSRHHSRDRDRCRDRDHDRDHGRRRYNEKSNARLEPIENASLQTSTDK